MTEVRNTVPQVATLFGTPFCPNIDELSADVAFLGIPYEQGQTRALEAGQKWAPEAIRNLKVVFDYRGFGIYEWSPFTGEESSCGWFDYDTGEWQLRGVTMADCGDVTFPPAPGESNYEGMLNCDRITEVVGKILDRGALPVSIGGDHTIAFPIVRAFNKYDPLDIVYFDAHLDNSDTHGGVKIANGTGMRRCSELPYVHNITQIGSRGFQRVTGMYKEGYEAAVENGNNIITAERFRQIGVNQVVKSIPEARNIYVTVDIDVFDPPVAPAVALQEPGGLSYLDVKQTLNGVAKRGKVVGFDLVCFIPARDPSNVTARVVSHLILNFLAAIFPSKR